MQAEEARFDHDATSEPGDAARIDGLDVAAERLMAAAHAEAVILFGSHASGRAKERSDIDVCVVIPQDANPALYGPLRLWPAVTGMGLDLDIVRVRPGDLRMDRDDVNSLAYDIAREGILLKGSIDGFFRPVSRRPAEKAASLVLNAGRRTTPTDRRSDSEVRR